MTNQGKSPAVVAAKEKHVQQEQDGIFVAPCGSRVKVKPVSASLVSEVSNMVKNPDVPVWHNPDKDRDEPNPDDPTYRRALEEADQRRATATIDAIVLFGVDLIDGLPEDDTWLTRLKFMQKRGLLDLSSYDLDDEMELEFIYKRYVVVDNTILEKITALSGVRPEDVELAEESFPSS